MVYRSIFNDVLGPVMAGPSSSHSAGCARIGRLLRLMWGREIKKAVVIYDSQGSYPSTCVGQGSNFGFTGGLLGLAGDNPRMKDSLELAAEQGADISFAEEKLSARHPNEARVDIYGDSGEVELSALTLSTGGGMFEIVELNGFPVFLDGGQEKLYLCCHRDSAEQLKQKLQSSAGKVTDEERGEQVLLCAEQMEQPMDRIAAAVEGNAGVLWVRKAPVVLPVPVRSEQQPPFTKASEALRCYEKQGEEMWQMALNYECTIGNVTPAEVIRQTEHVLNMMKRSTTPPDPQKTKRYGFLPYQSADMAGRMGTVRTVQTGCLDKAMMYALAAMENSCAHNIIVAAPTAGSCGVVPGSILAVGEEIACSDVELLRALLAAGLVGVFIANQATFGAEVAACQAEIGSAAAMAAAGVVQLLGGTAKQGFAAASLALQNMLGLICDPVGGLTEIPCISRNVSALSNAVTAANMVMMGFDPVIPLDETILCMYDVGKQLPAGLRCTCGGGLCQTDTAKEIVKTL